MSRITIVAVAAIFYFAPALYLFHVAQSVAGAQLWLIVGWIPASILMDYLE